MNRLALAIAAGLVFVGVLAWRLVGRDSLPVERVVPAIEQVSMATPIPLAVEEASAQTVAPHELVQAMPMPEAGSPEGQAILPGKPEPGKPPVGWGGAGPGYATELDHEVFYSGNGSLRISSLDDHLNGRANAGQVANAGAYRGKRVELSAKVRTENVSDGAALWFRVDGTDGGVLAFDNMLTKDRKLQGNTDWSEARLVLDVPDTAGALHYGLILAGRGKAWMDDVRIKVVDEQTPVTRRPPPAVSIFNPVPGKALPSSPRNLDFEQ